MTHLLISTNRYRQIDLLTGSESKPNIQSNIESEAPPTYAHTRAAKNSDKNYKSSQLERFSFGFWWSFEFNRFRLRPSSFIRRRRRRRVVSVEGKVPGGVSTTTSTNTVTAIVVVCVARERDSAPSIYSLFRYLFYIGSASSASSTWSSPPAYVFKCSLASTIELTRLTFPQSYFLFTRAESERRIGRRQ